VVVLRVEVAPSELHSEELEAGVAAGEAKPGDEVERQREEEGWPVDPLGQKTPKYNASARRHGLVMLVLGSIMFAISAQL